MHSYPPPSSNARQTMHGTRQGPSFVTTIYRKFWIPMNGHGLSAVITNNRKSDECSPANCWLIARHRSANTMSAHARAVASSHLPLFWHWNTSVWKLLCSADVGADDEAVIRYHKSCEYPPVWYRPHSIYRLHCKLRWQIHTFIWVSVDSATRPFNHQTENILNHLSMSLIYHFHLIKMEMLPTDELQDIKLAGETLTTNAVLRPALKIRNTCAG